MKVENAKTGFFADALLSHLIYNLSRIVFFAIAAGLFSESPQRKS